MQTKKNEIIIKLDGRMGNQMFQWAFARAYEEKNGIMPCIDDSEETLKLNHFHMSNNIEVVQKPLLNKLLRKTIPFRKLRNKLTRINYSLPTEQEEYFNKFSPSLLSYKQNCYFKGFFQTEKYFYNVRSKLLEDFTIKKNLSKQNQLMLEKIKSVNSVSVHFRRGDYTKSRVAKIFGFCSDNYYKKAIDIIAKNTKEPLTLFVFSDDINWVKNNIKFDYDTVFVDINSGKKGVFDLELMKNCKHNVIANSSFSWWGAWLNENPNKIVAAPTPWMENMEDNDLIPESWIKIEKE